MGFEISGTTIIDQDRQLLNVGVITATDLDISGDADIDGTLEADAITVGGSTLASVIEGTTVTNATNAAHVTVTDNESTAENNLITFVEDAQSATGNHGLEMDGNFTYTPSTGTVTATEFSGGGGNLTGLTGASAATYGDASNVAQIVVNSDGKITGISNVSISGGGGGGTSGLWASNATGINTSTNVGIATTTASAMLEIGNIGVATATTLINTKAWDGQTFNVDGNITSGSIFAVNDVSGLPVIDFNATHSQLSLGAFGGNVSIGYTNASTKLGLKGSTSERVYIVDDELSDMTSDTINIDNGNVQYFTTAEDGGTLTANITSNNGINNDLAIGDSTTVVVIIKPDSSSDKITNITIDGSAATEEWLGGSAPDGGANGTYDVYTFFILKTADATFLPLCNKVNFA